MVNKRSTAKFAAHPIVTVRGAARHKRGTTMVDDKDKALDIALGQIEKQFGKGSIM